MYQWWKYNTLRLDVSVQLPEFRRMETARVTLGTDHISFRHEFQSRLKLPYKVQQAGIPSSDTPALFSIYLHLGDKWDGVTI